MVGSRFPSQGETPTSEDLSWLDTVSGELEEALSESARRVLEALRQLQEEERGP